MASRDRIATVGQIFTYAELCCPISGGSWFTEDGEPYDISQDLWSKWESLNFEPSAHGVKVGIDSVGQEERWFINYLLPSLDLD